MLIDASMYFNPMPCLYATINNTLDGYLSPMHTSELSQIDERPESPDEEANYIVDDICHPSSVTEPINVGGAISPDSDGGALSSLMVSGSELYGASDNCGIQWKHCLDALGKTRTYVANSVCRPGRF